MYMVIRLALPAAIAASGITVAQLHGVPFWIGMLGSVNLGWTVSLTWEAASIWLWWRGDRKWVPRLCKWGATLALLGGMVAQGAGPLLMEGQQAAVGKIVLKILEVQSDAGHWISQSTLKKSMAVASGTHGSDASTTLPFPPDWLPLLAWAPVGAFPLLYGLALVALVTLSGEWRNERLNPHQNGSGERSPEHLETRSAPAIGKPNPERRAAVVRYAHRQGLTAQAAVARALGEHKSTFSEFINGKVGEKKAAEVMEKLGAV